MCMNKCTMIIFAQGVRTDLANGASEAVGAYALT